MTGNVCAITGASGYVGGQLAGSLAACSWEVRRLSRGDFDLRHPERVPQLAGVDALVHAAWDFAVRGSQQEREVNVRGSLALLAAAQAAGVQRIVFVSTLSAFDGTPSAYGAAKRLVERAVLASGGVVLRPGLVWSDDVRGMVGALTRLTRALPVVPVVGAQQPMWLCHAADLGRALDACLRAQTLPAEPVPCAHPQPLEFAAIVRGLARQAGRHRLLVPVPVWAVALPLRLAEALGLRLRIRSDGLNGLFASDPHVDFSRYSEQLPPFRAWSS